MSSAFKITLGTDKKCFFNSETKLFSKYSRELKKHSFSEYR